VVNEMKRLIVIIMMVIFIVPCCEGGKKGNKLKVTAEYKVKIPEPSDLVFSADGKACGPLAIKTVVFT
jgi:hypothetical protein